MPMRSKGLLPGAGAARDGWGIYQLTFGTGGTPSAYLCPNPWQIEPSHYPVQCFIIPQMARHGVIIRRLENNFPVAPRHQQLGDVLM